MRRALLTLALLGTVGACERSAPPPPAAAAAAPRPLARSAKDLPASAPVDSASIAHDGDFEIAVQLRPSTDYESELRAVDDAEPESLQFNSIEGPEDGVALADVPQGETVDQALSELRADPRVAYAEPLVRVHADLVPNDPQYPAQWNLRAIHMEQAWDQSQGEGVVVAVIDTGVAYEDHGEFKRIPDLEGVRFTKGYNFVADDDHPNDDHGHGTHVAGTIAQATNNKEGVAGIAFKATIMPIKVLDADGSGNSADIADAIRWAADHGAQVINMSLGGGAPSQIMGDAVAYARKKGVVVVCAAGNAGRGVVEFPAAYPGAIAVSATGPSGELAPYSSWGKELDIAAPGGDKSQGEQGGILQQTIDPSEPSKAVYAYFQGTSMAAPHVAGAAAILIAAGAKGPDEVEQALFAGAEAGQGAWNDRKGHGALDVLASLEALHAKRAVTNARPSEAAATASEHEGNEVAALEQPSEAGSIPKFLLGLLFAVLVAATLRKRERGTLGPALLTAMMLSAAGLWFLPKPAAHDLSASALRLIELPIPDWGKWLFGPGRASPLFYSALIPFVLSIVGYFWKASRPVMSGVAIGFAAFLGYCAWSGAPAIAWMPLRIIALPWLVVNLLICLVIGRALLRKESSP